MAIYSDRPVEEVRLERLRPEQIDHALGRRPAIYVPFGALEWHGYQNPVGLDALKAHEQLVGLAQLCGGLVYPPVYFGAGGGHTDWAHTFMVSADPMVQIVAELLSIFEREGFCQAILLSGHYPNRPEYLDRAVETYRQAGGTMRVLALIENQAPGVPGDHASMYETSSMLYLYPELVDAQRVALPPEGLPDRAIYNWMGPESVGHPNYGLVGIDPRGHASPEVGWRSTQALLDYLRGWLDSEA